MNKMKNGTRGEKNCINGYMTAQQDPERDANQGGFPAAPTALGGLYRDIENMIVLVNDPKLNKMKDSEF